MELDTTIIIPVYVKTEEGLGWLDECLNSAMGQGCNVVAYDDGSLIDVRPLFERYAGLIGDNGKFILGAPNCGVSKARNIAVEWVTTRFILPLDSDDRLKPDAVKKMIGAWNGVPIYPDIAKFGEVNEPWFVLLDFSCEHIITHVGFSSVNVLHEKRMWKEVGGWNELTDFYEDGEYNAKLFSKYCGVRFPEPLVEYRIHSTQRTKEYNNRADIYARKILADIRRLPMACASCGGSNRAPVAPINSQSIPSSVDPNTLPGELDGRVLSRYVGGKGKGWHYQDGHATKFSYKVLFGEYFYVDPRDTREEGQQVPYCFFVRVHQTKPEMKEPELKVVDSQKRVPVSNKAKRPV